MRPGQRYPVHVLTTMASMSRAPMPASRIATTAASVASVGACVANRRCSVSGSIANTVRQGIEGQAARGNSVVAEQDGLGNRMRATVEAPKPVRFLEGVPAFRLGIAPRRCGGADTGEEHSALGYASGTDRDPGGAPGGVRTHDLRLRADTLSTELRAHGVPFGGANLSRAACTRPSSAGAGPKPRGSTCIICRPATGGPGERKARTDLPRRLHAGARHSARSDPRAARARPRDLEPVVPGASARRPRLSSASFSRASSRWRRWPSRGRTTRRSSRPRPRLRRRRADLSGEDVYNQACVACHGAGVAGAPKFGDKAACRSEQVAQGADTLHKHAIRGYQGKAGLMPPRAGARTYPTSR